MSDKGLLFKKRKNNHGSHNRCSQGSGFPDREFIHYEKCQYHAPRFLGNYWCDMDGKMLFLPVYHVPGTYEYAKYWTDTHGVSTKANNLASKLEALFE